MCPKNTCVESKSGGCIEITSGDVTPPSGPPGTKFQVSRCASERDVAPRVCLPSSAFCCVRACTPHALERFGSHCDERPARTRASQINVGFVAHNQTGVGTTQINIDNYQEGGGGTIDLHGFVLNEGFAPGERSVATVSVDTSESRWLWVEGHYEIAAEACMHQCENNPKTGEGEIYDLAFGKGFNITTAE